jgi:hypothetical protein
MERQLPHSKNDQIIVFQNVSWLITSYLVLQY